MSDAVSKLHKTLVRQIRCDDVFCDIPSHIPCRAIDLGCIFSAKRATTMDCPSIFKCALRSAVAIKQFMGRLHC
ncbi:MAG: hypothetical protein WBZ23_16690, partial [Pseudolabrys sp.]